MWATGAGGPTINQSQARLAEPFKYRFAFNAIVVANRFATGCRQEKKLREGKVRGLTMLSCLPRYSMETDAPWPEEFKIDITILGTIMN